MVRVFRIKDTTPTERSGYSARYYADVQFNKRLDTAGFIFVTIPNNTETVPHAHENLEELFIALSPLSMIVNEIQYDLVPGDLLIVEPNEFHSIKSGKEGDNNLVAIKCPNLKNDKKIEPPSD